MSDPAPRFTGAEFLRIPPGRALLSDRRTRRRWQVDLPAYLLAATPVTAALYAAVAPTSASGRSLAALGSASAHLPVVNVSWRDAVLFCNALSERDGLTPPYTFGTDGEAARLDSSAHGEAVSRNAGEAVLWDSSADGEAVSRHGGETVLWDRRADGYRLPTEAEWEHACRAGTVTPRYGDLDDIAWYRANSEGRPHPVAGRQPNAWGLHDMLGNSWDWCWDLYDEDVYGSYRVLRGGGWFDEHWSCRASVRRRSHPAFTVDDVGFRLARSLP